MAVAVWFGDAECLLSARRVWVVVVDVDALVRDVVPSIVAVLRSYGSAVWDRLGEQVTDEAADASVSLGRRVLRRLLPAGGGHPQLREAVAEAAVAPDDADTVAVLRVQLRKVLTADADLAGQVALWAQQAGITVITASGERSIASGTNTGMQVTGDGASIQR